MKHELRAIMAAVAAWHATGRHIRNVYDFEMATHRRIDVKGVNGRLQAYDHDHGAHINGTMPTLYHHGIGNHIRLTPQLGNEYSGYDYDSNAHFTVNIQGSSATLYDHDVGSHFHFQI